MRHNQESQQTNKNIKSLSCQKISAAGHEKGISNGKSLQSGSRNEISKEC